MGASTFREEQLEAMGAISLDEFAAIFISSLTPASSATEGTATPLATAWVAILRRPFHHNPLLLLAGGEKMDRRVIELIEAYRDRPHIFNLGHGVLPETPIKNVERVLEIIRNRAK